MMKERKVVVVVFLDLTGLHSIRILPAVEGWFDRYALRQLMVIGVVTPDLDMQKDAVWVRSQVHRLGIEFPVILDGDRKLWKAYRNDGWPYIYVIDRKSNIVFDHLGEGGYDETENEIRESLYDLTTDALPPAVNPTEPRVKNCSTATPDIAMGARSKKRVLILDNDTSKRRLLLVESRQGELATKGKWDIEPDGIRLAQRNDDESAFVRAVYVAPQAFAVLAPAGGKPTRFFVKMDDQWLYEGIAGKDIRYDDDGRSYVQVDALRLYDLARDSGDKPHELYILPEKKGGGVYGFSFANSCTVTQLP